jgi:hypothetical protein
VRSWWKWIGLAGLLGAAAAAGAVVVVRRRRSWTEYSHDELREKLHERLRQAS